MKATKKQISEVTAAAIEMNVPVANALTTLSNCSASIYACIGAKGVVESAAKVANDLAVANKGGISFAYCGIVKVSEKAYLLSIPMGTGMTEKWIAKSVIKDIDGDTIVPFWAINR